MGMHMPNNCDPSFYMNVSPLPPPPPPIPSPVRMHCGDLRENHHGMFVEMDGKVNRNRLGRFIELKDQYGVIQLVAPIENISVSKRFVNMPLNSFITIIGQVKRRPDNLKNFVSSTSKQKNVCAVFIIFPLLLVITVWENISPVSASQCGSLLLHIFPPLCNKICLFL